MAFGGQTGAAFPVLPMQVEAVLSSAGDGSSNAIRATWGCWAGRTSGNAADGRHKVVCGSVRGFLPCGCRASPCSSVKRFGRATNYDFRCRSAGGMERWICIDPVCGYTLLGAWFGHAGNSVGAIKFSTLLGLGSCLGSSAA